MNVRFERVLTAEQIAQLAKTAGVIWREYWPSLMSTAQLDYMLDKFQSADALTRDINTQGYEYWFIEDEGSTQGYIGVREESESERLFISKVYLYKEARGKGYARKALEFLEALCKERGLNSLYLTVNKQNEIAIRAYKGLGLKIVDSVVADIGGGFVMDDYIMKKTLD